MMAAEFVQKEKAKYEALDWVLSLVPANAGGSDLRNLPGSIKSQLDLVGIRDGTPIEKLREFYRRFDWSRDEFTRLFKTLPQAYKERLGSRGVLSVGSVNDAEFNGYVRKCDDGCAIIVPNGALMLISFCCRAILLAREFALSGNGSFGRSLYCRMERATARSLGTVEAPRAKFKNVGAFLSSSSCL